MICTRDTKYISDKYKGKKDKTAFSGDYVKHIDRDMLTRIMKIFDVEKNDFRSFSLETLKIIEIKGSVCKNDR